MEVCDAHYQWVWCLPEQEEEKLNALHQAIVRAVASIKELGVKDEKDITCLFPPDMMKYGLGTEIIVEVTGLFDRPDRTDEVRQQLAERIGKAVREQYPKADLVECFVYPFQVSQGFWTSRLAESTSECDVHGSIEHMQAIDRLCPKCGKP